MSVHGRRGGDGPPVLPLHGIPETHLMWHRVAPRLAERFTVVATDLRGFGDSGAPPSTSDHTPYSMREIALDQIEVMRALGHERFAVVGHDRGARCAYRMALDHQLDEADRGRRRIACPGMVLWSSSGTFDRWDPLEVWRIWADDVRGGSIAAGHFLPEEAPEETVERLLDFLDQDLQKQEGDRTFT
jgi:haloacetate dehalogenase